MNFFSNGAEMKCQIELPNNWFELFEEFPKGSKWANGFKMSEHNQYLTDHHQTHFKSQTTVFFLAFSGRGGEFSKYTSVKLKHNPLEFRACDWNTFKISKMNTEFSKFRLKFSDIVW